MLGVYISVPILVGYQVMEWSNGVANQNIENLRRVKLNNKGKMHVKRQNELLDAMLREHEPGEQNVAETGSASQ